MYSAGRRGNRIFVNEQNFRLDSPTHMNSILLFLALFHNFSKATFFPVLTEETGPLAITIRLSCGLCLCCNWTAWCAAGGAVGGRRMIAHAWHALFWPRRFSIISAHAGAA